MLLEPIVKEIVTPVSTLLQTVPETETEGVVRVKLEEGREQSPFRHKIDP